MLRMRLSCCMTIIETVIKEILQGAMIERVISDDDDDDDEILQG